MAQWSAWNWIAYGCLAISAFGTAFGTIFQKYPQVLSRLPPLFLSPLWSFVPATFLILATVIFAKQLIWPSVIEKSELTLYIYGDDRWPKRLSETNVWRYFYLRNLLIAVNSKSGEKSEFMFPNLFICFDKPTKVGTLDVQSPDMKLPRYEVKEFKERFAIISFENELPAGTLTVKTH